MDHFWIIKVKLWLGSRKRPHLNFLQSRNKQQMCINSFCLVFFFLADITSHSIIPVFSSLLRRHQVALFHTATLAGQMVSGLGLLPLMLAPGQKKGNILWVKKSWKV